MRRVENSTTETITVVITKLGAGNQTLNLPVDSTVADALNASTISRGSNDSIWVNGSEEATTEDILDDGDMIQLVGNKGGGVR